MYLSRQDWGAVPSRRSAPVPAIERTHILLHSEDLRPRMLLPDEIRETVWNLQRRDMFHFNMPDIRYNFLLAGAVLVEGRGWLEPGFVMSGALCLALLGEPERPALEAFYAEADYRIGHPLIRQAISEKETPYVNLAAR